MLTDHQLFSPKKGSNMLVIKLASLQMQRVLDGVWNQFPNSFFLESLCMNTVYPVQCLWKMKTPHLNLFASSMNGLLSRSESSFQSAPSRFEISELCIFGFSWAIFLLWPRDHTMKAFMGRLIWSPVFGPGPIMLCWRKDPSGLAPE